jgi:protocatechuate 4,5-dioxygenase alpha chain
MGNVITLADKKESEQHSHVSLHQLCASLSEAPNRKLFRAFPEGYCRQYELSLEEIHAVTDLDIVQLLRQGLTLNALQLLTGVYDLDLDTLCLEQTGKTLDEVISRFH